MDKLDRLEAEASRRSTALARAATTRLARRFTLLRLADEALGRLGSASEVVGRTSLIVHRHPIVAAALLVSAPFLGWQILHSSGFNKPTSSRSTVSTRRRPPQVPGAGSCPSVP